LKLATVGLRSFTMARAHETESAIRGAENRTRSFANSNPNGPLPFGIWAFLDPPNSPALLRLIPPALIARPCV
jgi:hypothetical protein